MIDELFEVLRKISATDAEIPRSYEVLQELRDISSMAMEYFDEKIVPTLKVTLVNAAIRQLELEIYDAIMNPNRSVRRASGIRLPTSMAFCRRRQDRSSRRRRLPTKHPYWWVFM